MLRKKIDEAIKQCYENYLHDKLKLVQCGVKDCSNMLYHMYQNTIDHTKFYGGFEEKINLVFRCLDCMSKCVRLECITGNISKPSNKSSDIIEVEDEEKYQDKNVDALFDDTDSLNSDSDNDVDSNNDDDSSVNDTDDDELYVVEFDNEVREISENKTLKSNESNTIKLFHSQVKIKLSYLNIVLITKIVKNHLLQITQMMIIK